MKYKLSICVLTINRARQLREALKSCLVCKLPDATEFVIIDNASTDDTEAVVRSVMDKSGYDYYYEKLPENLGVGGGRNYAFSKTDAEYIYVLDDDAVIAPECKDTFFIKALEIFDQNHKIATLTTQIYDICWKKNRVRSDGPKISAGIYICKIFCGGSHFLRKEIFPDVPYLPNQYGYEEMLPSLRVMDAGLFNAVCPELLVIHKPAVNKWDWSNENNHELLINEIAIPYAINKMIYPLICRPLLWGAMQVRVYLHLRSIPDSRKRVWAKVTEVCNDYKITEKIKLSTVCRMVKLFGLSAF